MTNKRIIGAVGIGNKTYTAGMEEEFEAAATAGKVDMDRLEKKGVIRGYGKQTAEAVQTVNRQRKADGTRADVEAVEAADAAEGAEEAAAPKAAKKAAKKRGR
jgi:hypothetical protein